MLTIRRKQIESLCDRGSCRLEARLEEHVRQYLPQQCKALGDETLAATVKQGMERARALGMISDQELCKYVLLAVYFGPNLDMEKPWARSILHGPPWSESRPRIDCLFEEALRHTGEAEVDGGGCE